MDEEVVLRRVTYAQFANAINVFAWWLEEVLGKGEGLPTVAYIGSAPHDSHYGLPESQIQG